MKTVSEWEQKRTIRYHHVIGLWLQGFSYAEIGEMTGFTRQAAQQCIQPTLGIRRAVRATS